MYKLHSTIKPMRPRIFEKYCHDIFIEFLTCPDGDGFHWDDEEGFETIHAWKILDAIETVGIIYAKAGYKVPLTKNFYLVRNDLIRPYLTHKDIDSFDRFNRGVVVFNSKNNGVLSMYWFQRQLFPDSKHYGASDKLAILSKLYKKGTNNKGELQ